MSSSPIRAPRPLPARELPQLELECMRVLWREAPASVRQVQGELAAQGLRLAYTTVLTLLDRLARKQAVSREKHGRAFLYSPRISREHMRSLALERLLHNYFHSRQDLAAWLRSVLAVEIAATEPERAAMDASLL